jgi:hypothetical protein
MTDDPLSCGHCARPIVVQSDRAGRCVYCGTPHARHNLPPEKFPLKLKLVSGTTGAVVWSRVVTIDEARGLAKVEIPSFADSEHYPVRAEIEYADGTTEDRGMQ